MEDMYRNVAVREEDLHKLIQLTNWAGCSIETFMHDMISCTYEVHEMSRQLGKYKTDISLTDLEG